MSWNGAEQMPSIAELLNYDAQTIFLRIVSDNQVRCPWCGEQAMDYGDGWGCLCNAFRISIEQARKAKQRHAVIELFQRAIEYADGDRFEPVEPGPDHGHCQVCGFSWSGSHNCFGKPHTYR